MKLETILEDVFDAKDSQMNDDFKLTDFETWDSMAHMMFIVKIEQEFGVNLTGDQIAAIKTIGDIKKVLATKTT